MAKNSSPNQSSQVQTLKGLSDPKPSSGFQSFSGPGNTVGRSPDKISQPEKTAQAPETAQQQIQETRAARLNRFAATKVPQTFVKKPSKAEGFNAVFKEQLGALLQKGNLQRAKAIEAPASVMPKAAQPSVKSVQAQATKPSAKPAVTPVTTQQPSSRDVFESLREFFRGKTPSADEQLRQRAKEQQKQFTKQQESAGKKGLPQLITEGLSLASEYLHQTTIESDPAIVAKIQQALKDLNPEFSSFQEMSRSLLVAPKAAPVKQGAAADPAVLVKLQQGLQALSEGNSADVAATQISLQQALLLMALCMMIKTQIEIASNMKGIQIDPSALLQYWLQQLQQTGMLGAQKSLEATQALGAAPVQQVTQALQLGQQPGVVINHFNINHHETTIVGDHNQVTPTQTIDQQRGDRQHFNFSVNTPDPANKPTPASPNADQSAPKSRQVKP